MKLRHGLKMCAQCGIFLVLLSLTSAAICNWFGFGSLDLRDVGWEKQEKNSLETALETLNHLGCLSSTGGESGRAIEDTLKAHLHSLEQFHSQFKFDALWDKYLKIQKKTQVSRSLKTKLANPMGENKQPVKMKNISRTKITIASIECGEQENVELRTMLKSAIIFSQDAALHSIVFVDKESFGSVAVTLLELKWAADALSYEFSFELHLEWFPKMDGDVDVGGWKNMYKKCATQRLFFPSRLPHVDSLIYMDTDMVIVSNLTELWLHLPNQTEHLAGMAANNEPLAYGWYQWARLPHYGINGLNAGIMLMNLTQMREFKFQEKSIVTETLYKERIKLADQDIINIIFSAFPGEIHSRGYIASEIRNRNRYAHIVGEKLLFRKSIQLVATVEVAFALFYDIIYA